MKKFLIFLALILSLSIPALGESFSAPDAFTLDLPAGWKSDYSKNSEYSAADEGYYFLGYIMSEEMVMELEIQDCREQYGAFSLYRANKRDLMTYMEDIEALYEEESISYLETFQENPSQIPFLLYHVEGGSGGEFYYADTISGGWCILLYYYPYYADDRLTDQELDTFKTILSTFQPIR